eukprot:gene18490-59510_t
MCAARRARRRPAASRQCRRAALLGIAWDAPPPTAPELVPRGVRRRHFALAAPAGRAALPASVAGHVRWLAQKHALGQDALLVGPPGPHRRRVAMLFCELSRREVEYVALSRDTTSHDLRQRRELRQGAGGATVDFVDSAAVRAAVHGRVLVLDGVERAERNVLPTLNNLLEAPQRYDALLAAGVAADELRRRGLLRVHHELPSLALHPSFRVVGIALPVPAYAGHPLDPPLRSRFQLRRVDDLPPAQSSQSRYELLRAAAAGASRDELHQLTGARARREQ